MPQSNSGGGDSGMTDGTDSAPTRAPTRADTALARLAALHPKLIDLGLGRTRALLARLGDPHRAMPPAFHIAGTNGKGSTLAFLRGMLEAAGHRIHAYTSPHLVRFAERIRIAGRLIGDDALADLLEEVERANDGAAVTFFEVTTAAAMLAFARSVADFTLLEVGLGGRLDSTNVLDADALCATIITPIARDHEHFLGNALGGIAREKAGIMRPKVPVFVARQDSDEALEAIMDEAQKNNAPLYIAGRDFSINKKPQGLVVEYGERAIAIPQVNLIGDHQKENCGLAAATLMHCLADIPDTAIIKGAGTADWPGRIALLPDGKLHDALPDEIRVAPLPILVDGAHNAHGANALARALQGMGYDNLVLVCGALNTRPPDEFLKPLAPLVAHAIALTIPDSAASLTATDMAKAARACGITAETAKDIREAVAIAATHAQKNNARGILISGSLYLAGVALAANGTLPE